VAALTALSGPWYKVRKGGSAGRHLISPFLQDIHKHHSLSLNARIYNVNKGELIDLVAESADLSKAAATKAVEAVIDGITNTLKSGDTVTVVGFGTFSVTERAARTGRNPQTGETINIKASKTPKFKAGKALKDAVN
jgi:DNA-binding protein HU-beta